jgi:phospholipase/carboxylesterase
MTDFSFFDSQPEFDSQPDDAERPVDSDDRFACSRRFVDLTHTLQADGEPASPALEDFPAHPEIIELIESMLVANPTLQPSSEAQTCQRPHAVYVPEHYEEGYAYPLIVWFHGDGASESELARVMPSISDRNYIGVALRGDQASGTGFGWSPNGTLSTELLRDVRSIVTSLRREYHIHSERIYLAGFGSGATTAVQLMLNKPEWFGGVISFSGGVPRTESPVMRNDELKNKRILLATSLGSTTTRVGDVVAAGRLLYSAGMQVGTRVYQGLESSPTIKMLRDLDSWLMDDICGNVKV